MIRQSLILALSFAVSSSFECSSESACDNHIALCGEGSKCVNPSGTALGGCCVPEGTEVEETTVPAIADYVRDNCGHEFACDNELAPCWSHSECVNPSGEALSGCCIPNTMDPNEIVNGIPSQSVDESAEKEMKKKSDFEHLRGVIADYVIDNCGPAFACDNESYGCSDESKCINPSGEMLSGCCIPKEMDPNEIEKGLPLQSANREKRISEFEHLRGIVADYVIDNCGPAFACDNTNYGCSDDSKCINPSGEMLSGCCIPDSMDPNEVERGLPFESVNGGKKISEFEHLRGVVADYVIDNCGPAFACDNTNYGCSDDSKCINPSGEMLSGCCIPDSMDPNEIGKGLSLKSSNEETAVVEEIFSEWEHLRGVISDYVIDNCGPAFACDNNGYGCFSEHSKCINPSGEMLSGCCIPKEMDPNEIEKGLPLESFKQKADGQKTSEFEHLRGVVADYVIDNCGPAFACDNTDYGCADHSKCINPSGEMLSGCCIPKEMNTNEIERGLPEESIDYVTEYVRENCGIAFACDSVYGCADHSKCVNPSGETLSGCCIPESMDPNEMEKGLPLATAKEVSSLEDSIVLDTLNGIDLNSIIAPYVMEHCGPAFACDNIGAKCNDDSSCINPSEGPLAGCCVPKGMTKEDLEGGSSQRFESQNGEFGTLNGINLKSVIAPYVMEYCGPAFACDDIGAKCGDDSACINPSEGPLAGCCVPKGMTKEQLESGKLTVNFEKEEEVEMESESICSATAGQCIPRVFAANATKYHEEL